MSLCLCRYVTGVNQALGKKARGARSPRFRPESSLLRGHPLGSSHTRPGGRSKDKPKEGLHRKLSSGSRFVFY